MKLTSHGGADGVTGSKLLIEAAYGNRIHPKDDVQVALGHVIRRTVQRGGSVLLPSFAVGRAQALLLVLQRLKRAGDIPPSLPIFLDSPMAIAATEMTLRIASCWRCRGVKSTP